MDRIEDWIVACEMGDMMGCWKGYVDVGQSRICKMQYSGMRGKIIEG